ncbi:hypothetical protein [Streptomyces sp. NPDC012510]|uniref:hypothetical protein n=1 Tax=Streptomyces sp. NPDC012510 TaxID=3364838 RepID=UPI0036E57EAD
MRGRTRARGLRFASTAVIVVLALTGFSTGRGSGGSGSSGSSGGSDGGGGGCSSSSQDHDSSSSSSSGGTSGLGKSDYDDDYDDSYDDPYDDGSSGSGDSGDSTEDPGESPEDGTAKLVSCASSAHPYATVEVTNPNAYEADFVTEVAFVDKAGRTVVADDEKVTVSANGVAEVKVYVGDPDDLAEVEECEVEPEALWTSS